MSNVSFLRNSPAVKLPEGAAALRVVTVAYRSGGTIRGLLQSLESATNLPIHTVVVDNSETADLEVMAACKDFGAEYRSLPSNPGFGKANNFGADFGGPEPWILFANPDLRLPPGSVDALLKAAKAHPQSGVIGPALVDETGKRYPTGRSFPYLSRGIGHALFGRVWPGNPWTRDYWGNAWKGKDTDEVDWVSGACILMRREDFEQLGGFDPAYFMYFEDMDLAWRDYRESGRRALLVGSVEAVHLQGATTGNKTLETNKKPNLKALRAHHESAGIFLDRLYGNNPWMLPVLILIKQGLKLRYRLLAR